MKIKIPLIAILALIGNFLPLKICFAKPLPERGLVVRQLEQNGPTHIKLRATAFEKDGEIKYPIKTLDRNSFQIKINNESILNQNISLTTFDNTRRLNSRAMIWIYDATGIKSTKGLTRDLRTLVAQEFSDFQPEYLSILGVAAGRTIERIHLTPSLQENIIALRRNLMAEPNGLRPSAISYEPAICVAAKKFELWNRQGLKPFDQKAIILMGGSSPIDQINREKISECVKIIKEMKIAVQQIVFSKQENINHLLWASDPEITADDSIYRIVDLTGASRAIQNIKATFENEYVITAQLPVQKNNNENLELVATYHDSNFKSNYIPLERVLPAPPLHQSSNLPNQLTQVPQKFTTLTNQSVFVLDAWIEWLFLAIFTGFIVTILHSRRMNTGITEVSDRIDNDDVSNGPLLVVLNGKDKGRKYCIRQSSTLLGKGWTCDIRLQPLGVKNKHVKLDIQGDKAVLHDLSEGDLIVNGRAVRAIRVIGHGSVIRIGELHLLFQCGES